MNRAKSVNELKIVILKDVYGVFKGMDEKYKAINAGYSERSASSQASQLLKNPKVFEYLEIRESELAHELRQEFFFDALEARKVMHDIMKDGGVATMLTSAELDFDDIIQSQISGLFSYYIGNIK